MPRSARTARRQSSIGGAESAHRFGHSTEIGYARTATVPCGRPTEPARAIEGCVRQQFDAVEERARVLRRLEADDVAAEQAFEQRVPGGSRLNRARFGQGMCQNATMMASGKPLAEQRRQQREVVVLHEDHRPRAARFGHHGVRKPAIDLLVVPPVAAREPRRLEREMAQRPQRAVREAVVVAALFAAGQPHPTQRVAAVVIADPRGDRTDRPVARSADRRIRGRSRCRRSRAARDRAPSPAR